MDTKKIKERATAELVDLQRTGAPSGAYAELIERHYPACLARARSILRESAAAEDAVQDAFVRALLKLDQLEEPEKFPAWLDRIVVSSCVSSLRRRHPELLDAADFDSILGQLAAEDATPDASLIATEQHAAVLEAIDDLPDRYRDPIRLYHLKGRSYKSIARILNLPLGTVQSLISRARKKLRVALAPYARVAERALAHLLPGPRLVPIPIERPQQHPPYRRPVGH